MALDVEEVAARWVLGQIPGRELPDLAIRAFVADYDGPALRELAGEINPALREVREIAERALDELGASRPSRNEAARLLARRYATRIMEGSLSPLAGAQAIWNLVIEVPQNDHTLGPFIYWASEYTDASDPARQRFCESAILENARDLADT